MDISTIKSYEEFELTFEDYKKELILDQARTRTNEYLGAVDAVNSFTAQLSTATADQVESITQWLEYWKNFCTQLRASEPNILNPSKIEIVLTEQEEQTLADLKLQLKKALRTKLVDEIIVTVNDKTFDGDETSQIRMARAIQLMANDTDSVDWILADNQPAVVTKLELIEAAQKAAAAQVSLWNVYK